MAKLLHGLISILPLLLSALLDFQLIRLLANNTIVDPVFLRFFFLASFTLNVFKPHHGSYYLSKIIIPISINTRYAQIAFPFYLLCLIFTYFIGSVSAAAVVVIVVIQLFTDSLSAVFKHPMSSSLSKLTLISLYIAVICTSSSAHLELFVLLSVFLILCLLLFFYYHFVVYIPDGFIDAPSALNLSLFNFSIYNLGSKGFGEFSQSLLLFFYGTRELAFARLIIRIYTLLSIPYEHIRSTMSLNSISISNYMSSRAYIWLQLCLFGALSFLCLSPAPNIVFTMFFPEFNSLYSLLSLITLTLNLLCFVVFNLGKNYYIYKKILPLTTLAFVNFATALCSITLFMVLVFTFRFHFAYIAHPYVFISSAIIASLFLQDALENIFLSFKYNSIVSK